MDDTARYQSANNRHALFFAIGHTLNKYKNIIWTRGECQSRCGNYKGDENFSVQTNF